MGFHRDLVKQVLGRLLSLKKKGNADFHGLYGSWKDGNTDFKSH